MTVPARSLPRLALTALVSSAVLEGQPVPSPPPTFPATVETVTLDVAVTDRSGRPLLGLGPADFVVSGGPGSRPYNGRFDARPSGPMIPGPIGLASRGQRSRGRPPATSRRSSTTTFTSTPCARARSRAPP